MGFTSCSSQQCDVELLQSTAITHRHCYSLQFGMSVENFMQLLEMVHMLNKLIHSPSVSIVFTKHNISG